MATLCTSPGGTQYTVLTQGSTQQQYILQTTNEQESLPPPPQIQPQVIAPKEDLSSPPIKRRAFAVKSTTRQETYDDMNDRPRRKIFATKSTVTSMGRIFH
jgi:FtsP/CotA-like multicopper oxidase with cupredoxin domain